MNIENNKTSEPHKYFLDLSQRSDLRSSEERVALQNVSIYYTWKNIRKQYKNNKLKIIAPTLNDEFDLPDSSNSVSDIQDYTEYIIEKHETLTTISPIHLYINIINNRLVLKIKDEYSLKLQTPETMELFGSTKKLIDKTKNGETVPSLEVVEVLLVQCNLVDNQYQQKFKVLYTLTPNKFYAYSLNVEPSNVVFLKTYNTGLDKIVIKLQIKMVNH